MGSWQTFDTNTDRTEIVDEALAAGMNLFDSSPMYGRAEDTLARAVDGRRSQAIIATKIWTGSAAEGRAQAERALRILGRVEIYQVHNLVAWETQLRMLEQLKGEGKVMRTGRLKRLKRSHGTFRAARVGRRPDPASLQSATARCRATRAAAGCRAGPGRADPQPAALWRPRSAG
jgi:aryl-alcohol dehydrogenase-like predicted oxidoreductase